MIKNRAFYIFLSFCALAPFCVEAKTKPKPVLKTAPAEIKPGMDIVAVVNQDAITSFDVDNRIRFIISTTGFSDTPDIQQRIRPQIIRSLIDERLQMQDATKNDIKVSDQEVQDAIKHIESERSMPPGAISAMLQHNNVPLQTFTDQVRSQIAWGRTVSQKIRPQTHISDEEVALAQKRLAAAPPASVNQELQIGVVALPVDKPQREAEMRKLADKLVGQVKNGANFEEVARQFSRSASPSESFWVRPVQLDPLVGRALAEAKPGLVTSPIRTQQGFTIVKVYNVRSATAPTPPSDAEVLLKEILLKLKGDASPKEADVLLQIGEEVAKHPGSCEEKGVASIKDTEDFEIAVDFKRELLSQLPDALRLIAGNLKIGDISTPFASNQGIRLYMLCDKKITDGKGKLPDRDKVYALLMQQKLELEAQKYIRNLRREAFVDVRQ